MVSCFDSNKRATVRLFPHREESWPIFHVSIMVSPKAVSMRRPAHHLASSPGDQMHRRGSSFDPVVDAKESCENRENWVGASAGTRGLRKHAPPLSAALPRSRVETPFDDDLALQTSSSA